jgi:hypothetical protein
MSSLIWRDVLNFVVLNLERKSVFLRTDFGGGGADDVEGKFVVDLRFEDMLELLSKLKSNDAFHLK